MAAVDDGEIITTFLLSTYRLQPTVHDAKALVRSATLMGQHPPSEPEAQCITITLISGSSAEFYIKPMLPCVDDIDIMHHRNDVLAIPAGYPAPTVLPDEFHSRVHLYEIIDSEYTGYVYLKQRYLLIESNDDGVYNTLVNQEGRCISYARSAEFREQIHGPATTLRPESSDPFHDLVHCVRCLLWPPQAAIWPTRHRNHDWPDSATVDHVVRNGCDVVFVAHRLCKHDEWESKAQWRLSFSRAELVLLNSWMPIQQIVYHMLRIFVKTERLTGVTDNTGTKIISNYHIKSLMLWACELKQRSWWTEDANAVRIGVELLHTLAVWLTDFRCSHYFIGNCNLMYNTENVEVIIQQLGYVSQSYLSTWFLNNYIYKCAQLCPGIVLRMFNDVSTSTKLDNAASAVVAWRHNTALDDLFEVYFRAMYRVALHAALLFHGVLSCAYLMNGFAKLNLRLSHYLTAIVFLHIAIKITKRNFNIESMDVLSTVCGQAVDRRRCSSHLSSVMLIQAAKLMKVAANNSVSNVQLIEIELSKAYLYRALRCKDSDNDSIYCIANVYLAVLYYITGQYQTAIDHCKLVTRSQDHSQCTSHAVEGELVPNVDDNIDNVLGLIVFYQFARRTVLNQKQQTQHVNVFTPELFAHYLLIRCLPPTERHQLAQTKINDEIRKCYWKHISDRQGSYSLGDLLLFKSLYISPKFQYHFKYPRQQPTQNQTDQDMTLVELLRHSAVEHLTTFRQVIAREFDSLSPVVTTDFQAGYAYKHGDYQLCLNLSTQNLRTLWHARLMTDVYTFPEFVQLLDDDIVSLTALTLMVDPTCREESRYVGISQLTLSLYLMTQCQLKLRHSATELAQTLQYIEISEEEHPAARVLDRLTLKLAKRKAILYLPYSMQ